jgi:hypothetical protein
MEKDWTEQLHEQMGNKGVVQVSIDGQIWTIDAAGPAYSLTNQFGNTQSFTSPDQLITALQSRFENPTIAVL